MAPLPAETVMGRVRALEREVGRPGSRREYGHHQLIMLVELKLRGVPEAEALAAVGPPAQALEPWEKSVAELIAEAAGLLPRSTGR